MKKTKQNITDVEFLRRWYIKKICRAVKPATGYSKLTSTISKVQKMLNVKC